MHVLVYTTRFNDINTVLLQLRIPSRKRLNSFNEAIIRGRNKEELSFPNDIIYKAPSFKSKSESGNMYELENGWLES